MEAGATLIAPETVTFSHDTVIGRDVLIEPNVVFGPGVTRRRRRDPRASPIWKARNHRRRRDP